MSSQSPLLDDVDHDSNKSAGVETATPMTKGSELPVSNQIKETLPPCVGLMKSLISKHAPKWESKGGINSLAQGVVHWSPPPSVTDEISSALLSSSPDDIHTYGPEAGLPALVSLLTKKIAKENGLYDADVMVTAGANQAYVNCVLTLLSTGGDKGVVFAPYYFNHVMALQMSRGDASVVAGPTVGDTGVPDVEWLEGVLARDERVKMVTLVNPGNPTGVSLSRGVIREIVDVTKRAGVWLVVDNTYEHFDHVGANSGGGDDDDDVDFYCASDPHVINIFSFSKGYSLAGYRVGYLTIAKSQRGMFEEMLKVQDTIPICVSRLSQIAAIGALKAGREWVTSQVQSLSSSRNAINLALSPLSTRMGGSGAMYVMAELPAGMNDEEAAEMLVEKFGVAVIPGSFCGFPGWLRISYSNLPPAECILAAARLAEGIEYLVHNGKGLVDGNEK
eukprot:CAMPEP_0172501526 /NCGR_PEP_ID=MMETSP1066-20121228/150644_1 /TAXON_ID=671091 /ORGANISM="Coscinodiscus wailesii, Strain CCMP2513" /LENGTH=447 /DNA_ID=CAMNT_0013276339 /DNA_START=196 /DNA_END=1539 /DNA_ORIENTATION=+